MELDVNKGNVIGIDILQQSPQIDVKPTATVEIDVQRQDVSLKVPPKGGVAFEFVQKVVAGSNVVRCTYTEFQSMAHLDGKTWYAVTTTADELRYLYLGPTLIAKASDDGGTWGFAYTFPIIFGR